MLLILGSLLLGGCAHLGAGQRASTLKGAYGGAFVVGSAVNEAIVSGADTAARDIVVQQFNSITAENVLKAERINPQPGVYAFGPADAFVEFSAKHEMFIVGHTLVWHNQTPAWFFQDENGKPNTPDAQLEEFKAFLDPYPNGLPADVQKALTDRYAELFGIFYRKRDKIDRVTLWGVHDGMSWKNGYPVPGRTNYPLLYSRDLLRKRAFDAVLAVPRKTK